MLSMLPILAGPLEGLAYVLGPLIAAGVGAAATAIVSAFAVGLLAAAAVEALALTLVFALFVSPRENAHWLVRPLVLALVGTLAACASLWLTGWLLLDDEGHIGNFVLPFVPAILAFLVALACAIVLSVRAAATLRGKENESHADRAGDAGRRLLRAVYRLAAAVVFAAAMLVIALALFIALAPIGQKDPEGGRAVIALAAMIAAVISLPATFLARAGRPRPA